ncbi:hypothetical protein FOVSG1_015353 [Fusarium oxysporum f. sp. vasinfectum]
MTIIPPHPENREHKIIGLLSHRTHVRTTALSQLAIRRSHTLALSLGVLPTQDTNMLIKKWDVYSCNLVPNWITALISCLLRPNNTCEAVTT